MPDKTERITLAGGCFWCIEAVFKRINGVAAVLSGYAGGPQSPAMPPTYEQVSSGKSAFAEAVQVEFEPAVISLQKLLEVFWAVHDPTTMNRQGNDVGPQYRSAIFYTSEPQKSAAEQSKAALDASGKYGTAAVTAIEPLEHFFSAEEYHLDYYDRNRNQPYCRLIIDPKIQKLYKNFKSELKEEFAHVE